MINIYIENKIYINMNFTVIKSIAQIFLLVLYMAPVLENCLHCNFCTEPHILPVWPIVAITLSYCVAIILYIRIRYPNDENVERDWKSITLYNLSIPLFFALFLIAAIPFNTNTACNFERRVFLLFISMVGTLISAKMIKLVTCYRTITVQTYNTNY